MKVTKTMTRQMDVPVGDKKKPWPTLGGYKSIRMKNIGN